MRALYSPISVGDYCHLLNDKSITVNEDYQRKGGLWTSQARSFFIESILLEYPIPKIFLYAKVDLKDRSTIKEIVDGQQRSLALQQFYNKKFKLSTKLETEELRGKNYNQLDDAYKSIFLSYSLPIDEFRGVQPDDIQESFRRMNASNVPLNDEEQRNARFQGAFKWFIQSVAKRYSQPLAQAGLFSRRDIIRMVDTKNYAEIVHVVENGFVTTKATQIDTLYKKYNVEFDLEESYREMLYSGIEAFLSSDVLHQKPLLKHHIFQTLISVFMDRQFGLGLLDKAKQVSEIQDSHIGEEIDLATLLAALDDPEEFPQLFSFVEAASKGTNVGKAKAVRFVYFNHVI
jgi:hypothetical protein